MTSSSGRRAGLFIDDARLALAEQEEARPVRITEHTRSESGSLADDLRGLLAEAGNFDELIVAIGRPLAHVRTVELPQLPRETAERVIARDADRYVIGTESSVVAARMIDARHWSAAFVPSDLLAQIASVASSASVVFTTADDVLATSTSTKGSGDRFIVVCATNAPASITHARNQVALGGRRFLGNATADDVVRYAAERGAARGDVVIIGDAKQVNAIAASCGDAGMRATTQANADGISAPATIASLALTAVPTLPLRAPADRTRIRQRDNVATRWLFAGLAAALLIGAALEQAIVSSRLRAVSEQRAVIAAQVTRAMASRDSLLTQTDLANAIAEREAHASRTGGALAAIALALPAGATLSSLQVAGDSVRVEGQGRDGAAVYDALKKVGEIDHVTLAAPLRSDRTVPDAVNAVGHFAFSARLRSAAR